MYNTQLASYTDTIVTAVWLRTYYVIKGGQILEMDGLDK